MEENNIVQLDATVDVAAEVQDISTQPDSTGWFQMIVNVIGLLIVGYLVYIVYKKYADSKHLVTQVDHNSNLIATNQ